MSDTPITDRAKVEAITHMGWVVPVETCRDFERVANQLFLCLKNARDAVQEEVNTHINNYGENYPSKNARLVQLRADVVAVDKALAAFEAMKKGTT